MEMGTSRFQILGVGPWIKFSLKPEWSTKFICGSENSLSMASVRYSFMSLRTKSSD